MSDSETETNAAQPAASFDAHTFEMMAHDEGVRYFVYDDATGEPIKSGSVVRGNPTIALGRNLASVGLSAAEVSILFQDDWAKVVKEAEAYDWFSKLDKVRAYVVCNMIFNLGAGGFYKFKIFQSFLERGLWEGAGNAMMQSKWAQEVPSRAAELKSMIETGVMPKDAPEATSNETVETP